MKIRHIAGTAVATLLAATLFSENAGAKDFYAGRTVTWVVGAGAGGNYGLYAQLFAPYLEKHIPGNPTIVPQFNPKGGGRVAASFVSNAAPKDGTVIAMVQQTIPVFQLLEPDDLKFDVREWQWIGNLATVPGVIVAAASTGVKTAADLTEKQVIMGATGKSSETFMTPTALNNLTGAKFKIVTGYRGAQPIFKALQSGEVSGFSFSWLSVKSSAADQLAAGKIVIPVQTGLVRDPDLPDVPTAIELGPTAEAKSALRLLASSSKYGRAIWAPPGTPAEQLAILRAAFDKAVADPGFRAELDKRGLPLSTVDAAGLAELTNAVFSTDDKTVAATRAAVGMKN